MGEFYKTRYTLLIKLLQSVLYPRARDSSIVIPKRILKVETPSIFGKNTLPLKYVQAQLILLDKEVNGCIEVDKRQYSSDSIFLEFELPYIVLSQEDNQYLALAYRLMISVVINRYSP